MRGIRRALGTNPTRKAPAIAEHLTAMAKLTPESLSGARDRALLLVGFAGALRRSELVALRIEDVEHTPEGVRITIQRSKTDQEGQGQVIAIPHGGRLQPVRALMAWLEMAGITDGPLFRPIGKSGRVRDIALTDRSVANIVKHYAEAAGFDPATFSGHSLRAGFLTSAASVDSPNLFKMAEQSRHKSLDTLRAYVRDAELFRDHAGAAFL